MNSKLHNINNNIKIINVMFNWTNALNNQTQWGNNSQSSKPFNIFTNWNSSNNNTLKDINMTTDTKLWTPTNNTGWNSSPSFMPLFTPQPIIPSLTDNSLDLEKIYEEVSNSLVKELYSKMETDFPSIKYFFDDGAFISYVDLKCTGVQRLFDYLKNLNVTSMKHNNYKILSQPAKSHIFILVTGEITCTINGLTGPTHKYSEMILLSNKEKNFYIKNYMFNIF